MVLSSTKAGTGGRVHARGFVGLIGTLCAGIALATLAGCSNVTLSGGSTTPTAAPAPALSGERLFLDKCQRCHGLERVNAKTYSRGVWDETVQRMQSNGLRVTDAERAAIIDYLVSRQTATPVP
jgi:mono/diheme cytochrome c family protein